MSSRATRIQEQLISLSPVHFELENESDQHSGPKGRETHFKLLIVSPQFENQSRVDRQRQVFDLLKNEMQTGLHALSLRALTPEEWEKQKTQKTQNSFQSPECKK
jgi:stress-induced morphogen